MSHRPLTGEPRIAIIHDWLVTLGGAERVLLDIIACYPQADLFCIVQNLAGATRHLFPVEIRTTFIQKLPLSGKLYWYYAPLMPLAVEQIDLSEYDIVLTSSHCFAKGIIIHPHQLHIAYVHSPARFIWDLQFDYYRSFSFTMGCKRVLASVVFHFLRLWDTRTANGVDVMIANSRFIRNRILKCYRRDAEVIYPGIDTELFSLEERKQDYYVAGSFMNPFKKLDLIVRAFSQMPDKPLRLFGAGPQLGYLRKIAAPNITFVGRVADGALATVLQHARAFVFSATEDFGMIMAEAQACGTPVIAYRRGGASEIVIDIEHPSKKPTGILFTALTEAGLIDAVRKFEAHEASILPAECRSNALRFARHSFKCQYTETVSREWEKRPSAGELE